MNPAQTQLYFRTWQSAAKAHGWTSKAGCVAALAAHYSGQTWESPELNKTRGDILELADGRAASDERDEITADDIRHAATEFALGRKVSSKNFTNADFDCVLALLRLLADPQNIKNLVAVQNGGEAGERRRHVHVITRANESYWQRISTDRFGHAALDRLSLTQLRQLSLTIRNRIGAAQPSQEELVTA